MYNSAVNINDVLSWHSIYNNYARYVWRYTHIIWNLSSPGFLWFKLLTNHCKSWFKSWIKVVLFYLFIIIYFFTFNTFHVQPTTKSAHFLQSHWIKYQISSVFKQDQTPKSLILLIAIVPTLLVTASLSLTINYFDVSSVFRRGNYFSLRSEQTAIHLCHCNLNMKVLSHNCPIPIVAILVMIRAI